MRREVRNSCWAWPKSGLLVEWSSRHSPCCFQRSAARCCYSRGRGFALSAQLLSFQCRQLGLPALPHRHLQRGLCRPVHRLVRPPDLLWSPGALRSGGRNATGSRQGRPSPVFRPTPLPPHPPPTTAAPKAPTPGSPAAPPATSASTAAARAGAGSSASGSPASWASSAAPAGHNRGRPRTASPSRACRSPAPARTACLPRG